MDSRATTKSMIDNHITFPNESDTLHGTAIALSYQFSINFSKIDWLISQSMEEIKRFKTFSRRTEKVPKIKCPRAATSIFHLISETSWQIYTKKIQSISEMTANKQNIYILKIRSPFHLGLKESKSQYKLPPINLIKNH